MATSVLTLVATHDPTTAAERQCPERRVHVTFDRFLGLVDELLNPLETPGAAGLVTELVAQAGRDEELSELVVRNDLELRAGIAGLLDKATRQGRIDGSTDSATAATWVAGLVDAMYSRASIDPDFDPVAQRVTLRLILERFLGNTARG